MGFRVEITWRMKKREEYEVSFTRERLVIAEFPVGLMTLQKFFSDHPPSKSPFDQSPPGYHSGARKIPTDILESMLDFVLDRRGTSSNILIHPYLQDVHSSSFTALLLLILLHNFSCFTGELDHFSCCDTPAVTHQGIMARYCRGDVEKTDTKTRRQCVKMSAAEHPLLLSNYEHGRDKTASKTFSQEKIVAITIRKKSIRKIAITSQEQLISGRSKVKLMKNNI
ncbi:hypothetical protein DAPPUDRAFT_101435 [Daphnia pulex]|uniref:Uncharacterized protein n=1 Tax=Daphnia pulex TaxID=6669 RepID=E9GDC7_DAPPU|nr:hypothetical protein DAPPUDRAFT_101435 [Daphnia pulex]|eukprot:EFX82717.1 hypothetical protein DAPPUDRAFT_101435 [Daphnia pulex]